MTDDGDEVAPAARPHAQHAKAIVLVMEGDAFDKPRDDLTVGCQRLRLGVCGHRDMTNGGIQVLRRIQVLI
jgi:hypothetical protein